MPLEWQRIAWRPLSGLDQYRDELLLDQSKASEMKNVVLKGGRAETRRGFTRFGSLPTDDTAKSIFSANGELCVVGDKRLYAWSDSQDTFVDKGKVPVASGELTTIHEGETSSLSSDLCVTQDFSGNKFYVEVYGTFGLVTTGDLPRTTIGMRVLDAQGATVYQKELAAATNFPTAVYGPRCITLNTTGVVVIGYGVSYNDGLPTGSEELHFYTWNPFTPTVDPVFQESVTDVYIEEGLDGAPFDMVAVPSSDDFVYSYVQQTSFEFCRVRARQYLNGSLLNPFTTSEVTTTSSGVKLCAVDYDATNDYILLATARTATNSFLEYNAYSYADGLPAVNPVVLVDTLTSVTDLHSVAISAPGTVESTSSYPGEYCAMAISYSNANEDPDTDYVFFDTDQAAFGGNVYTFYNTTLQTQPFWKNNRCYVGLVSHQEFAGYAMPFVVDTGIGDDEVNGALPFTMVAAWDFGAGPSSDITRVINTVLGTGFKLSAPPKPNQDGEVVSFPACSIGTLGLDKARYEQNKVELDFGFRPQAVPSIRGSVALTGSVMAWYDGVRVTELGIAGTPNADPNSSPTTLVGTTGISAQNVQYSHYWRNSDNRGVVFRGVPSKPLEVTIDDGGGGGRSAVDINLVRHSCTMRDIFSTAFDDMHPVGFVTGTVTPRNENFQRYSEPGRTEGNFNGKECTVRDAVADTDELGGVIYTTDQVDLDAEFPPGCKFAANARDRLFLVGAYRGDEVRYSDQTAVGDLTGDVFAPEFNSALALQSPNGERFTGATESLDRIVLFTASKVYAITGLGPTASGAQNDFSGLIEVNDQYGCKHERSIVRTPVGTFFQSGQGLCLLSDDMAVRLITDVDTLFDSTREVVDACHDEGRNQVYFMIRDPSSALEVDPGIVVFNYVDNAWYTWQPLGNLSSGGISMCMHRGEPHYLDGNGSLWAYNGDDGAIDDRGTGVEKIIGTPWLRMDATTSGWGKVRNIFVSGKANSSEYPSLTMRVYYDFDETAAETYTLTTANAALSTSGTMEWRVRPGRGNCTSLKVEIQDAQNATLAGFSSGFSTGFASIQATTGQIGLRSIDFELGRKGGTRKVRQELKS